MKKKSKKPLTTPKRKFDYILTKLPNGEIVHFNHPVAVENRSKRSRKG